MPTTLRSAAVLLGVLGIIQCIYDFTHNLPYPPEGWKMIVASLILGALASGMERMPVDLHSPGKTPEPSAAGALGTWWEQEQKNNPAG